jgi:hypothetical protein
MPNTGTASTAEFSSASSTGGSGFETSNVGGIGGGALAGGGRASFYEQSSSYSGDASGFGGGGAIGDFGPTSYGSSAYRSSIVGLPGGIDVGTAFAAADTNNDGVLSLQEFRNAGY